MQQSNLFAEAAWAEVEKPKPPAQPIPCGAPYRIQNAPPAPPYGHLAGQYWTSLAKWVPMSKLHKSEDPVRARMHCTSRRLWTFDENPCDWIDCHDLATHAAVLTGFRNEPVFALYCSEHFVVRPKSLRATVIEGDVVAALKKLGIEEYWAGVRP